MSISTFDMLNTPGYPSTCSIEWAFRLIGYYDHPGNILDTTAAPFIRTIAMFSNSVIGFSLDWANSFWASFI